MLNVIKEDLFNISGRLKSIDESYFAVFNSRKKRFEVHSDAQRGNTLAVVLPFDRLDARTLTHVRYTRAERAKEIMLEIDKSNAEAEKRANRLSLDKALDKAANGGLL